MADDPLSNPEKNTPPYQGHLFDPVTYSTEQLQEQTRRATEAARPTVDFTAQLNAQVGTLTSLLDSVGSSFRDIVGSITAWNQGLGTSIDQTRQLAEANEQVKTSTQEGARASFESAKARSSEFNYMKALTTATNDWNDALKNSARLREQASKAGMLQEDQFVVPGEPGQRPRYVDETEFRRILGQGADDPERQRIMQETAIQQVMEERRLGRDRRFRTKEFFGSLLRGDIGSALGEAMQQFDFGERFQTAGRARMAQGGLGSILGAGQAGLGFLLRPAGALAAIEAIRRVNRFQQETLQVGQITGEGRAAGLQARADIAQMAINPFDMLSRAQARQIVEGVRGQGFRGEFASAMSDAIGDVVQDLGTDVGQTLDIARTTIKTTGMSIEGFRNQMEDLDDTAKASGQSITNLTSALAQVQEDVAQFGGLQAVTATGPAVQELARQFRGTGFDPERHAAAFLTGEGRRQLGLRLGFRPDQIYGPQFSQNIIQYINTILFQLASAKPRGWDWIAYVQLILQDPGLQQLFGNTPYNVIANMMKRVWRDTDEGRDPGAIQRAGGRARAREARQRTETVQDRFRGQTEVGGVDRIGQWFARAAGFETSGDLERSEIRGVEGGRFIRQLGQQMRDMGMPDETRVQILQGLRAVHHGSGDREEWRRAQQEALERFTAEVKVNVGFTGQAQGYLNALNPAYRATLEGRGGSQGVRRPPR